MISRLTLIAAVAFSGTAFAQDAPPGPPPGLEPVSGTITALDSSSVTLKGDNGTEIKISIGPNPTLLTSRRIDHDSIQPGSVVTTANQDQPDGTGRALEMRFFGPGSRPYDQGQRAVPGRPGLTVTGGSVTKVTKTAAGHELDIAFPGGTRHVLVPTDTPVTGLYGVDPAELKVGASINGMAARGPDGVLRAPMLMVNAKELPYRP